MKGLGKVGQAVSPRNTAGTEPALILPGTEATGHSVRCVQKGTYSEGWAQKLGDGD